MRNVRERFAATLAHERLDHPMLDYIAERDTDRELRRALGCDTEEALLDTLGSEFFYLPGRDISQNEGFLPFYRGPELSIRESERTCPFGIRFSRGAYDSKFTVDHAIRGPLEDASSTSDILRHPWPKPSHFDYSSIVGVAEAHRDRVLVGGFWSGILGDVVRLYGFERFLTDIALNPDLVRTLIDTVTDVYLELNEMLFSLLDGILDVYFFGNDFGTQNGLLMSVDMWREFYFENTKKLCDLAHSHGLAVMMHSCGAIAPLIEDFIEAGVDILDPVQTSAAGMAPAGLAERYGGRLVFHGGIDTQSVLPTVSPEEAADHAGDVASAFGAGYIACGSQLYGPDIPTENIIAVYRRLAGSDRT